ncbi:uncharacterized protein [Montipora capricornis]|uniref:uncharacterized protein isoform X1 n=1 Tax=Montipora capricornis TaxID=246305 RepID=UPI0035F209AA
MILENVICYTFWMICGPRRWFDAKQKRLSWTIGSTIFFFRSQLICFCSKRGYHYGGYARKRMFLLGHEKPEAIREFVERNIPATEIARDVCFGSKDNPSGSFKIKQAGGLVTLRVDYEPSLPVGETKDLKLDDEKGPVTPEYTTSDNIHFDFRFDYDPLEVTVDQEFLLSEDSGSGEEICVSVWGYYSDAP